MPMIVACGVFSAGDRGADGAVATGAAGFNAEVGGAAAPEEPPVLDVELDVVPDAVLEVVLDAVPDVVESTA